MFKLKTFSIGIILSGIIMVSGCRPPRSTDPNAGFTLTLNVTQGGVGFLFPVLANVNGSTFTSPQGTTGTRTFFNEFFTNRETKRIGGARVPAAWNFQVGGAPGSCSGLQQFISLDDNKSISCNVSFAELFVFPSMIDARTPGNNLSLSGQTMKFDSSAMPKVFWYNEFGQVVHVTQASYGNSKGSLDSVMPNMTNWANGRYLILLSSSDNPSESTIIGSAVVTVYGNIDPIEPDDPPTPCNNNVRPCTY
jgi:hypothetical protein